MAYISFRQSDQTQTEAQTEKKNKVLNRPLTFYEVDANFKAINDQVDGTKYQFGLGSGYQDGSTLDQLKVSDLNAVKGTGFYTTTTNTKNVPTVFDVDDTSSLLHIESVEHQTTASVGAFQLVGSTNFPLYRARSGQTTWGDWHKLITEKELKFTLDNVLTFEGGYIEGSLTYNAKPATRDGATPCDPKSVGFQFYDKLGFEQTSKLGSIGLNFARTDSADYNNVSLSSYNPVDMNDNTPIELSVGWEVVNHQLKKVARLTGYDINTDDVNHICTIDILNKFVNKNTYLSVPYGGSVNGPVHFNEIVECHKPVKITDELTVTGSKILTNRIEVLENAFIHTLDVEGLLTSTELVPSLTKFDVPVNVKYVQGVASSSPDENDTLLELSEFGAEISTDIISTAYIGAKQPIVGSNNISKITISVDKQGNATTSAPNPHVDSNDASIATTKWVVEKLSHKLDANGKAPSAEVADRVNGENVVGPVDRAKKADVADLANSVYWSSIINKPNVVLTINGKAPKEGNIDLDIPDINRAILCDGSTIATGTIRSSKSEGSWVSGAKGACILSTTLGAGQFVPYFNYPTQGGGSIVMAGYQSGMSMYYVNQSNIDSGTNNTDWSIQYHSNGNVNFPRTVFAPTFQSTSDIRKKENLVEIEKVKLDNLQTYQYNFKQDPTKTNHIGLIAQQVQTHYPQLVAQDEQGTLSIDYNGVVALLVGKINELEKRIEQLEHR